jgi:signal transduction histidine kinase
MGEMISMIAHQWRQPLNAITLTTAALELNAENERWDKRFFQSRLERISNYAHHLSSTIEDFRNFFKSEKKKEETTFADIIERTLTLVQSAVESKNITIRTEFHCKHTVSTYPNELLQVAMNLIKNAEDALVENNTTDPTITIKCYSESDKSVLEIADNAGGIDPSIIDNIFDPYFTTKEEHNGTGLGLYMSKMIIEEHCKGILSVDNSSVGAVFKIVLNHS